MAKWLRLMVKRRVVLTVATISGGAIHVISAWARQVGLSPGQVKTAEKSNEITAIPALLALLEVKGCIITIDAMGCQTDISDKIIEKRADYVLAVKDNQKQLHEF